MNAAALRERCEQASARLNAAWKGLGKRERQALLLAVGALLAGAIDQGLLAPATRKIGALQVQVDAEELRLQTQRGEIAERRREAVRLLAEEAALRERIARADSELVALRASVTPPKQMLRRLRGFSSADARLRVVTLSVQPAEPVRAGTQALFRLPVEVTVEGDYAGLNVYLAQLQSSGGLRWQSLDLQTRQWPLLQLKLRVYTLGEQSAWPV